MDRTKSWLDCCQSLRQAYVCVPCMTERWQEVSRMTPEVSKPMLQSSPTL